MSAANASIRPNNSHELKPRRPEHEGPRWVQAWATKTDDEWSTALRATFPRRSQARRLAAAGMADSHEGQAGEVLHDGG